MMRRWMVHSWIGRPAALVIFDTAPLHLAPPMPPPPPPHLPPDHNIFKMVQELGIPWPFTDFERSGFWGRGGKLITEVRAAFNALVCSMQVARLACVVAVL